MAVPAQQYVAGLDVAVQHTRGVRGGERVNESEANCRDPRWWEWAVRADDLSQAVRVDQLHDDPVAFGFLSHVVDGDNRRAVQAGQRAGFAQHPRSDRVALDLGSGKWNEDLLDRYWALEKFVLAAPDDTSATTTDWSIQTVTLRDVSGCVVTRGVSGRRRSGHPLKSRRRVAGCAGHPCPARSVGHRSWAWPERREKPPHQRKIG